MSNCWISYLLPFEKKDDPAIEEFQDLCIKEGIFGIGWPIDCSDEEYIGKIDSGYYKKEKYDDTEKIKDYYQQFTGRLKPNDGNVVKVGDIVISRLRNGHYYVGKVKDTKYLHSNETPYAELSYGGHLDWHEIANEFDVPGMIRGRFSQQRHKTFQRVANPEMCKLIKNLYHYSAGDGEEESPIQLNSENFAINLDYRELEDLVYLFLKDMHKDYFILPSSGKISKLKYEFILVKETPDYKEHAIVCQVKNQTKDFPKPSVFANDLHFEKIYCFCGTWNDKDAEKYTENYSNEIKETIIAITPTELFECLKRHKVLFADRFRTI